MQLADKDISNQLQRFGLSENQALLYLLLVQNQKLRIQDLVNLSQMPRSSVYESLKGLLEKGLAHEVIEDTYKVIQPQPVSSLRHILDEKIDELQSLTNDIDKLDQIITVRPQTLASTTVRYYKGLAGARQLFWNTLKTHSTVYVYSAFGRSQFVGKKFYMDFVRESAERQIDEQVLINPTDRALGFIERDTGSPLARTKVKQIRCLSEDQIVVSGETFIYDNVYAQVYLDTGEINGFEIESSQFTTTQRSLFETLWGMATPVADVIKGG